MDVLVYEGWSISEQLDDDLLGQITQKDGPPIPRPGGKRAHVSIYPPIGAGRPASYQILDETYVITEPTINCAVAVNGNQTTLTGTPALASS